MAGRQGTNPKSLANLQPPWSAENPPRNPGRKPSKVKKYIKDNNITSEDVGRMSKYILPMNMHEIKSLLEDPAIPIIMKVFAKGILQDLKEGNYNNLITLFDRAFGKPAENMNMNTTNHNINASVDYSNLTPDKAKELFHQKIQEAKEV